MVEPEDNLKSNDSDIDDVDVDIKEQKKGCLILGEFQLIIVYECFSILGQLGVVLIVCDRVKAFFSGVSTIFTTQSVIGLVLSFLQFCSMPINIINNFSVVIRDRNAFQKTLIKYGGGVLATLIVFIYIYFRFLVPLIKKIGSLSTSEACATADYLLSMLFTYLRQINVFVDIFICILIAFFILYHPKKVFIGKKIIYFRLLSIFPIALSIVGYVLLALNQKGIIFPGYLYPLIPLKPPILLLVLISLIIYMRVKEDKFLKTNVMENYDRDFMTRETNLEINRFISKALAIGSALDFGMVLVYLFTQKEYLIKMGFGESCLMWLIIPIVKMIDFRKADEKSISMFIPIIGLGIIFYMWIEAFYWMASLVIDFFKEMAGL